MQRERERRTDIFEDMGDPFANFRGFGMMPSLFGRRDPFDDPFFTRPSGSLFEFPSSTTTDPDASRVDVAKGIVIEELDSDDENENDTTTIGSNKEPSVEHPDDNLHEKSKNVEHRNDINRTEVSKPQARNLSFQTCKVTYGGVDGAYYTSTRSRREGSDGAVLEESKEADKITGQATHRISRGIHDKGHSFTRKLASDGKVDTLQTLHNLNEGELAGFEEAWKGNVKLPGWSDRSGMLGTTSDHPFPSSKEMSGFSNREQKGKTTWGGLALPSAEQSRNSGATSVGKTKKVVRINID
ncbi:uncharacterized protein LOC126688317 isoform X2 [Mercurialis annua]|uniref:uncharacterized protein LOC126688317 isoform X2 n=1 Tax=Mercurialis annua TaxID=3986 RepID=UPI00215EEA56|nr:uncharacterized protein LOC126688317 isoform X2 [Mercurialis annua]